VRSWHLEPGYIALLAERAEQAVADTGLDPPEVEVLFTAHSLPARVRELGDPYPEQVQDTAAAVAAYAGLPRWSVAWQSAGRTPEPWLGPDLLHVLGAIARMGARGVVVCPAGFVSDHLEVLYDLDIEARQKAEDLGLVFARTASLNDDPSFCGVLARVVHRHLHDAG
jgi:ferrochelatase